MQGASGSFSKALRRVVTLRLPEAHINHARSPNVVIDPDGVSMRTTRAVAAGEELTIDYLAPPVPPAYLASAEGRFLASLP